MTAVERTRGDLADVAQPADVSGDQARAEGVAEWKILAKHALKNVATPLLTAIGIILAVVLAGAVVIEQIFALPGLGRLVVEGILRRDYPVIQGSLLVVAGTLVLVNLVIDLLYGALDPRVRYE